MKRRVLPGFRLSLGITLVYAAIKEVVREAEALRFQDALNRITKRQMATAGMLALPLFALAMNSGMNARTRTFSGSVTFALRSMMAK